MWFDVQAAVANIVSDDKTGVAAYPPANPANPANSGQINGPFTSRLAGIAEIAEGDTKIPNSLNGAVTDEFLVLRAIRSGITRHGAIATSSGLGATITYQLLDRLIASGQIEQAQNGILSEGAQSNDKPK